MNDGKLLSGQSLYPEQTIVSVGGHAHLHYQSDGNLVSYLDDVAHWASQTAGYSAGRLHMDPNGNLVLYDANGPIASTRTHDHPGAMVQLQDDGNFVIYEDPKGLLAGMPIWASASSPFVIGECVVSPNDVCLVPILGQLRRQGNLFAHDGGLITPTFSSEFPMLRMFKFARERYLRAKSDIIRYRLQGSREFVDVGGWDPYWNGSEVSLTGYTKWRWGGSVTRPGSLGHVVAAWPDGYRILGDVIEDFARAKLKLHLTHGDRQIIYADIVNGQPVYNFEKELEAHRAAARVIRDTSPVTVDFYEISNEIPMNSPEGGSDKDYEICRRLIQEVKAIFGRGPLCGLGAALSEEPAKLTQSADGGDVCFVHVVRDWPMCLKRTMGLKAFEGNWGAFPWPYQHGEPMPTNVPPYNDDVGDDGYMATDRVDRFIALHTMIALCACGTNVFTGASVKMDDAYPSEAPGYKEVPQIVEDHIPEDIATWKREHAPNGAILYFTQDKKFATSTDDTWNTTPPRPVASWKMYTGLGLVMQVLEGTGNPPQGRTGFIVGTFV